MKLKVVQVVMAWSFPPLSLGREGAGVGHLEEKAVEAGGNHLAPFAPSAPALVALLR